MSELASIKNRFRRLAELRQTEDEANAASDRAKRDRREYENELYDECQSVGITKSLTFEFGGSLGTITFTPRKATIFGRVLDERAARQSLENMGRLDEFVGEKFQERRINELVRDLMERGKELPPGIDFYSRGGITVSHKGQDT